MASYTIGVDLGDRGSHYCVVDAGGREVETGRVATTAAGMAQGFAQRAASRVVVEVGTHSPWVSRQLAGYGHAVLVANARKP
jgi:transposase